MWLQSLALYIPRIDRYMNLNNKNVLFSAITAATSIQDDFLVGIEFNFVVNAMAS